MPKPLRRLPLLFPAGAALASPAALACDGPPICPVIDPTGTPLDLRAEPGGGIWGTVRNGTVLRASALRRSGGKDRACVNQWTPGNAVGWVYDPCPGCKEDGGQRAGIFG